MKTKIILLLIASIMCAQAHDLNFVGKVAQSATPRFPLDTLVTIKVHYNPANNNIQFYDISIGQFVHVDGIFGAGRVFVQFPSVGGGATYQAGINSTLSWLYAEGQVGTPNGVAPLCIEDWGLKSFVINLPPWIPSTSGPLTQPPQWVK
jgi:hypothetical protein